MILWVHVPVRTAWALLLVVSLATSTAACASRSAVTVAELVPLDPAEHQRILREGMTEGRLLYIKAEQYQRAPSGNLPEKLIKETWLAAKPDGAVYSAVSTLHFPDGPETMDMTAVYGRLTLEEWLNQTWQIADLAQRAGAEFKGSGNLHGWESLIYEWSTDTEVQRLEIVEDAPLIARESTFAINQKGERTLTQSNTVLEYQLLPPGAEAPAVNGK